jgi:hypothetical protein
MYVKARRHLAALVLNLASLKLGQYTIVTTDNRTAGDVLTYVSVLLTDAITANDGIANNLAEQANNHVLIGSGIVPAGNVLYKGAGSIEWGFAVPKQFVLFQNYPNPFNPSTTIKFSVEETGHAMLDVWNILGQHVATLFDGFAETGRYHRVEFDASKVASGVYIYSLNSNNKRELKKFIVLK